MQQAQSSSTDELFVFGRNIYQAACGYANSATQFLADFTDKTAVLPELQRKAILDGMLYEVFFDSEGQHREQPKLESFDDLFKLQIHSQFNSSFGFIQGCLAPFADRYFEIPGNGREVTLSLRTRPGEAGARIIEDIWWDSVNILRKDSVVDQQSGWFAPRDRDYKFSELVEYLSRETVLPRQQLRVELDFSYTSGTAIIWPAAFEIHKPFSLANGEQD
jgi:hypothetical protein